jgi:hypothetical protein
VLALDPEEYINWVEHIVGIVLGILLLMAMLIFFEVRSRRKWRADVPPYPGGPGSAGPSGDREPRRPLTPAGSAAATVENSDAPPL